MEEGYEKGGWNGTVQCKREPTDRNTSKDRFVVFCASTAYSHLYFVGGKRRMLGTQGSKCLKAGRG
jgi:hypothetical protein